jgi:hypothetical protein
MTFLKERRTKLREIKFRGKSIDNEKWNYGYLCNNNLIGTFNPATQLEDVDKIIPKTISQYINYKDLNQEELYDGDIVYYHRHEGIYWNDKIIYKLGVICWNDKALGFRIQPIDTHSYKINYGFDGEKIKTSHRVMKIGNIFDNDLKGLVDKYLKQ